MFEDYDDYPDEGFDYMKKRTRSFSPMLGTYGSKQKRIQSLDDFLKSNDDFFAKYGDDQLPLNLKRGFFH